ncbi:hypothetical protein [Candidatus Deianiraea vastatrix]|uniref:Nicotinamide riboside transporter PnuC n=1 Tax=Candidatus Deianiraea vastatrix TaxID=2163644 RepID=A0A5B8XF44_9RICK|nr:hypothetical protein [Candidatus Deianiraea vastatrix]QED23938.1 hypothetical protein Deia_01161 [Candidatus Deianiraea vastatrix]
MYESILHGISHWFSDPEWMIIIGDAFMNFGLILEGAYILRSRGLQKIEVIIYLCFVVTSISYAAFGHVTTNTAQFYLNISAFSIQICVLWTLFYRTYLRKKK